MFLFGRKGGGGAQELLLFFPLGRARKRSHAGSAEYVAKFVLTKYKLCLWDLPQRRKCLIFSLDGPRLLYRPGMVCRGVEVAQVIRFFSQVDVVCFQCWCLISVCWLTVDFPRICSRTYLGGAQKRLIRHSSPLASLTPQTVNALVCVFVCPLPLPLPTLEITIFA